MLPLLGSFCLLLFMLGNLNLRHASNFCLCFALDPCLSGDCPMLRLFLLTLLVCAPAFADDHLETFLNTDVFELEIAADPQISPDGSQIVYVRNANDIMSDSTRANIWSVDADGSNHRPLLSGADSYSSPRWAPDGSRLAYVSSVDGRGPELYVRWMDTGQTALLSNLENSPRGLSWSPDGKYIAFSAVVQGEGIPLATPPAKGVSLTEFSQFYKSFEKPPLFDLATAHLNLQYPLHSRSNFA